MKKFWQQFLVEDWVVVIISIPLLLIAGFASYLPEISIPSDLRSLGAWADIATLFVIALVALFAGNMLLKRPVKKLLGGFIFVFVIAALALWIAKLPIVKYYGFEAVFFSVIFGLIIRNCFHIPEWLKPAIQGEYFIKIGVVCLGATILFRDVMKSGSMGLLQAILVVTIVWFFAYFVARKFNVDRSTAMTMSSGLSICGVSACITAARVAGTDDKKLSYIVSVVLIVVVPMIYLMPWLAETIVPLVTSDPIIQQEIAGAWIGGTVDTTSGVAASSEMAFAEVGDLANKTAVIVKATQNVLIGFVAFFIALYLSTKGEDGKSQRPSLGIVWEKFPKFIIGFIVASIIASVIFVPAVGAEKTGAINKVLGQYKDWAFVLAFTSIGLDTNFKQIAKSMQGGKVLWLYIIGQTFNIILTFAVVWLLLSGKVFPQPDIKTFTDKEDKINAKREQVAEPVAPAAEEQTVDFKEAEAAVVK
jgi:uncharacterized integral membrane protein (TIGR00698 family)